MDEVLAVVIQLYLAEKQNKENFRKKICRFVISEFVKTCDELVIGLGAIAIGQLLPDRIGPGRDLPPPPPERFGNQNLGGRQRNQRPRRPQPNRNLDFDVSPPNSRPELTIEG